MEAIHEVAAWVGAGLSLIGGIYYLSRQIDGKMASKEYFDRHRELEERVRRLELWAAKKSYGGGVDNIPK